MASLTNELVTSFLNHYADLEAPGYGVLIKGTWGSGKTYLIKGWAKKSEGIAWVSMFGITSISEFNDRLVGTGRMEVMKLGNSIIKSIAQVAFDSTVLSSLAADHVLSTSTIVILDDMERCSLEIDTLLGLANRILEHHGKKLILISNENDILEHREKEDRYRATKEKVVGVTFEVQPPIRSALEHFFAKSLAQIQEHRDTVENIFHLSGCKNLRHLKRAINNFEMLFRSHSHLKSVKPDVIHAMISEYLVLALEIWSGKLSTKDAAALGSAYKPPQAWSKRKEQEPPSPGEQAMKRFQERYSNINSLSLFRLSDRAERLWAPLLEQGQVGAEVIAAYLADFANPPDCQIVWQYYRGYTDDQLQAAAERLVKRLADGVLEDASELLMSADGLIRLAKEGILLTPALEDILKALDQALEQTKIREVGSGIRTYIFGSDSDFINFMDRLKEIAKENKDHYLRERLVAFEAEPSRLHSFLEGPDDIELLEPDRLAAYLVQSTFKECMTIDYFIAARLQGNRSDAERKWLQRVIDEVGSAEVSSRIMKYNLTKLCEHWETLLTK